MEHVILASASPRRRELLSLIFPDFEVIPSHAEEDQPLPENLSAEEEPEYLSRLKAEDIARLHGDALVIGSDTVVILPAGTQNEKDIILGKPSSKEDASRMLHLLSGRRHYVVTGCCLAYRGELRSFRIKTAVDFYPLTDEEIEVYIATGEPMDKAGAYGIQGKGALLVKGIEGDYYTVMGLPVAALKKEITKCLQL